MHPVAELGNRDPRGYYYVFGSDRDAGELVRTLTDLGFEAAVYHPYSLEQLTPTYSDSAVPDPHRCPVAGSAAAVRELEDRV
ncbi:hypothetical protein [Streptomyces sp. NBC_00057]|uniref:hypothetical protein n=1 Tax=Streptomyces sp. NBC_00057 TaxID=2975634 RepID=UPI00324E4B13